jgi:hypothetical protein
MGPDAEHLIGIAALELDAGRLIAAITSAYDSAQIDRAPEIVPKPTNRFGAEITPLVRSRGHTFPRDPAGMTLANIAIYVALIVFVIYRRMVGSPVGSVRRLLALPVVLIVLGWGDAAKGLTKPLDVTFTIVGCAISLVLGLARGRTDRLSERDGAPYVRWGWWSVGLFAANLIIKLVLDLAGIAAGETAKAAGSSLIISLGLTLLGEAAIVWYRSGGAVRLTSGPPAGQEQWQDHRRDQGDLFGRTRHDDDRHDNRHHDNRHDNRHHDSRHDIRYDRL